MNANNYSDLQTYILDKLGSNPPLRFSEIQPSNIENDLFNYHLQYLVKKGLVTKDEKMYTLSPNGLKFLTGINKKVKTKYDLFKLCTYCILFDKKSDGSILVVNQIRERQPFYGLTGIYGGALFNGESFEECAKRSTKNELKLEANFKLIGLTRSITYHQASVFQDILFGICIANKYTGSLQNSTYGTNIWVDIDIAIKNESNHNTPSQKILECLKIIKSGENILDTPFFYTQQEYYLGTLEV